MISMKNKRKLYIDGLKGFACCFVMLGHFCGAYEYAEDISLIQCEFMKVITNSFFVFFFNEEFWLYLFFVLSGFLL